MKLFKALTVLALAGLTACHSGWDKDPFAGESDNIKNAVPQGTDQKGVPPLQGIMFIDVEDSVNIKEGQERSIPISWRITNKNEFTFKGLEIEKLEDALPGATFDPIEGVLTFKAEDGIVPENVLFYRRPITVALMAEYKGLLQVVRKTFYINILRGNANPPEIVEINGIPENMFEEDTANIEIIVRDEASPNGPTLTLTQTNLNNRKNGAQFTELDMIPLYHGPGLFKFFGKIRLQGTTDITSSSTRFSMYFQAFSVFGVPSSTRTGNFRVFTRASYPHYFVEDMTFTVGQKKSYTFSVVDLKKEGEITAKFQSNCATVLGETALCRCEKISGTTANGSALCTIDWTPTKAGTYDIEMNAVNTVNEGLSQMDQQSYNRFLTIKVNEEGVTQ